MWSQLSGFLVGNGRERKGDLVVDGEDGRIDGCCGEGGGGGMEAVELLADLDVDEKDEAHKGSREDDEGEGGDGSDNADHGGSSAKANVSSPLNKDERIANR
jgi:hypothetical protein